MYHVQIIIIAQSDVRRGLLILYLVPGISLLLQWKLLRHHKHSVFAHLIHYRRTLSFSFPLPTRNSESRATKQALLPPPHYGTRLH